MDDVYLPEKLSVPIDRMKRMKTLLIGAGAVGSYIAEQCVKQCMGHVTVIDFDRIENGNFSKMSSMMLYPEDVGCGKAETVVRRCKPILSEGCHVNYIQDDIHNFGPRFLEQYDVVVMALDNFAAKWHVNQAWLQTVNRPRMIFTGTFGEYAEAGLLDGQSLCLRCTWSEESLKNIYRRTSCREAYLEAEQAGIVPTSALASSVAANLVMQLIRNIASGNDAAFLNKRLKYLATPNCVQIDYDAPMKRKGCQDCELSAAEKVEELKGDVLHMTMSAFFAEAVKKTGIADFEVVPRTKVVAYDFCPVCGRRKDVMKPLSRLRKRDITCPDHRGMPDNTELTLEPAGEVVFSPQQFDRAAAALSLYALGFQIGGIIEVRAGSVPDDKTYYFACADDRELCWENLTLHED